MDEYARIILMSKLPSWAIQLYCWALNPSEKYINTYSGFLHMDDASRKNSYLERENTRNYNS